jgi:hypothetical protein
LRLEGYCRSCSRKRDSASKREGESS